MNIEVLRFSDNGKDTLSLVYIDGKFVSYGLEDEARDVKVKGETRIPEGLYCIGFRKVGGFNNRYTAKFGDDFHKGMLQVLDVPGFEYILIHTGNTENHTAGCLLLGDSANDNSRENGFVGSSVQAYKEFYPIVRDALLAGENVQIKYVNLEGQLNKLQ